MVLHDEECTSHRFRCQSWVVPEGALALSIKKVSDCVLAPRPHHNLTMRMQIRRCTRITNAFSKKWENYWASLSLYFAYYNFRSRDARDGSGDRRSRLGFARIAKLAADVATA